MIVFLLLAALRRTWTRKLVIGASYPFGDSIGPSAPDSPVALTVARGACGGRSGRDGLDPTAGGPDECVCVPPAFLAPDVSLLVGWYEVELAVVAGAVAETTSGEVRTDCLCTGRALFCSGFGAGSRCGVRRTSAPASRSSPIRLRSSRKMLGMPPLNTAAKPSFDSAAVRGARLGPREVATSAISVTAAIARTAAAPTTARRPMVATRIGCGPAAPPSRSSEATGR